MKTLKDFNFTNKRVLVRCDFQVPFDEKGEISDDFRIKSTIPTIEYLIKNEAKIILMSHWQPEGKGECRSLKPISFKIEEILNQKIKFLDDCIGEKVEREVKKMKSGEIIFLENLRFHQEEKTNDENFAKKLAKLGQIYINDAFGVCHREHASVVGIPKYLPSGAGFLLEREIKVLSRILKKPQHPLVVIIGGAKIATKIALIEQFLEKADHLLLGGVIANIILIAKKISLFDSFLEIEKEIKEKIEKIELTNPKLHLPVDGIISLKKDKESCLRQGGVGTVKKEENIYDIGPETIEIFSQIIKSAKMIFWSGPLGMFEDEKFEKGTKEIIESIVKNHSAFKITGGGDTISALNKFGLADKFDHISTGGGAMLEFLADGTLPGIEALKD